MPKQGLQKSVDSDKFGGNSENARPQQPTKTVSGKQTTNSWPHSKIPVAKSHRVPLKRVLVQPTSSVVSRDTTSTRKINTKVPAQAKGVEARDVGEEVLKENSMGQTTLDSKKNTRVKKVPDFKKLHNKWQQKIEKAKREKRSTIEVREFPLTPSGKFTPRAKSASNKEEDPTITPIPISIATTSTATSSQTSPFEVDTESLHAILSGNGGEPPSLSQRATMAAWPRIIPGELRLPQTSYRYSMYRRRPEEVHAESECERKAPSMFSSVSHARGRKLLERLANTTLNSTRTVAKVNAVGCRNLSGIKMNLDSQLTEAEGNEHVLRSHDSCRSHPFFSVQSDSASVPPLGHGILQSLHSQQQVEQRPRIQIANLLARDDIYTIEPELCELLAGGGTRCIGGRNQCQSPVAQLLDQVYFVPVQCN